MFCHNKPLFRARSGVWALSAFGLYYKTLHDVSTFTERHYQVRVSNEIEYIYSEKMKF